MPRKCYLVTKSIFPLPQDFIFLAQDFFCCRRKIIVVKENEARKRCFVTISRKHFLGIKKHSCEMKNVHLN